MSVRRFLLFSAITLVLGSTACAQRGIPVKDDELKVAFQFVLKAGDVRKTAIAERDLPNREPIPRGYEVSKVYLVGTDSMLAGETILTATVGTASENQFHQARFLKLQTTELNPSGWKWNDCTIGSEESIRAADPQISEERLTQIKKYVPNLREKRISCRDNDLETENYFAVVFQPMPSPASKFSEIKIELETATSSNQGSEIRYRLLFRNVGNKTISELNFLSHFEVDTDISSFKTDSGNCRRAKSGTNLGSMVCYLEGLAPGELAVVELTAAPSNMRSPGETGPYNQGWLIMGVIKEQVDSPFWPVNMFMFSPLTKEWH